jgi:hypothetical protein
MGNDGKEGRRQRYEWDKRKEVRDKDRKEIFH